VAEDELANLPAEVRRERMTSYIEASGFTRVLELATEFGVSEVTVRSDLGALARAGLLKRVHGGAVPGRMRREPTLEEASTSAASEKDRIARHAARLVESGQSVAIDVGSTTTAVARALLDRSDLEDVTVITNALNIALLLEPATPRFTIVVTGGTLRPRQHSLVDPFGVDLLNQLSPDVAFVGCNGVDLERGVTNVNLPEAAIKRTILRRTERPVIVADSSKLGQVHLGTVCSLESIDTLITGQRPDDGFVADVETAGVTLVVAEA